MKKRKSRVLVLTDISSLEGGVLEPDDAQSLVRFLLYANEFEIEGLIATAYGEHGVRPDYIEAVVRAYGQVHKNLVSHDSAYPPGSALLPLIKSGSPRCGMENLGEGKDTEASEWIIAAADKEDSRPLWVLLWGGALDLAQAVWKVKHTRTKQEVSAFLSKLRVYAISDQYDGCGPWLKETCPELFYITNYKAFRGMYRGGDETLAGPGWVEQNVRGHGALGELYPMYHGGDPWGNVEGIKEGDTPSFLYLIPNGMHDPEKPWEESWGGWFEADGTGVLDGDSCLEFSGSRSDFGDGGCAAGTAVRNVSGADGLLETSEGRHFSDRGVSEEEAALRVSRWRTDVQADFAKRLSWCAEAGAFDTECRTTR